jgi:hypothetical protein
MGWFKKKSKKEVLQLQYEKLMKKSFDLSKVDRTKADEAYAAAQTIADEMAALPNE